MASTPQHRVEAAWAMGFLSMSAKCREIMSEALTALDRVCNTAQYLQSVPVSTERERQMAEMWHKMYVECGSKHDPITRNLLCEGVCTCNVNPKSCALANNMYRIDELVRILCLCSIAVMYDQVRVLVAVLPTLFGERVSWRQSKTATFWLIQLRRLLSKHRHTTIWRKL